MDLLAQLKPIIAPLEAAEVLGDAARNKMLEELRAARSKHMMTEDGRIALSKLALKTEIIAGEARNQERWRKVLGACEAYEILRPGSLHLKNSKQLAILNVSRPSVALRGFFKDRENENTYAFIDVTDPATGKIDHVQVRPGQEFHGLLFKEIIGRNAGIRLEYLAMPGTMFEVRKSR